MDYKIITEEIESFYKGANTLSRNDIVEVIASDKSIIKFLQNIQTSYRSKLANLNAVGSEREMYISIKCLDDIIKEVQELKKTLNKLDKEKEEKEEKENKKQ